MVLFVGLLVRTNERGIEMVVVSDSELSIFVFICTVFVYGYSKLDF
jgi:hypothetical protein